MRYLYVLFLLSLTTVLSSQNTNVTFRSKLTYNNQKLSNIWGYAAGGREYALVGAALGMSIVDVTNPDSPVEISQISGPNSQWREIKTYQHYAYIVSEGGSGVQIVDLTPLPAPPVTFHSYFGNGAINGTLTKAHALHVDESKGYLYLYGTNLFGGKAIVCNLNTDPYNPSYVNYVNFGSGNAGYVHDGYVDNDILYASHIYTGQFAIYNLADKNNIIQVATQPTPGLFTHNTWRNGNYLFTTDEVSNSFLTSYDISNTSNITQLDKIQSNPGSSSIVHNTYIHNDFAITSWYKDGFTIVDVSRPANMVQVGNYDTYDAGGNGFEGAWGVYPYLPSGTIVASNIRKLNTQNGELFVCTPDYVRGCYLEGKITDASNNNPLNGALIKLIATSLQENSASTGLYKMAQLQSGNFAVQVSKTGYITFNGNVALSNGVLTILNVALAPNVPLPVELVDFTATVEESDALLNWETASEHSNAGFEVQQSMDAHTWHPLGFVAAKGPSEYEFRVPGLVTGSWYFRLRQVDLDGKETFSPVRSIVIQDNKFNAVLMPNSVTDQCSLRLTSNYTSSVEVDIYDAKLQSTGLHWTLHLQETSDLPISVGQLPAGTYYVVVRTDREKMTLPFVKQ